MNKLFLASLLIVSGCAFLSAADDRVISVSADDTAMNEAIAAARKSLPLFWSKLEKPGPGEQEFNLKVRIDDEDKTEHFWFSDIQKKDGRLSGVVNNDPRFVKSVTVGQRVRFSEEQISDWLFMQNGKMVGNFTVRPLMRRMSKEQLKELEAKLAPLP